MKRKSRYTVGQGTIKKPHCSMTSGVITGQSSSLFTWLKLVSFSWYTKSRMIHKRRYKQTGLKLIHHDTLQYLFSSGSSDGMHNPKPIWYKSKTRYILLVAPSEVSPVAVRVDEVKCLVNIHFHILLELIIPSQDSLWPRFVMLWKEIVANCYRTIWCMKRFQIPLLVISPEWLGSIFVSYLDCWWHLWLTLSGFWSWK